MANMPPSLRNRLSASWPVGLLASWHIHHPPPPAWYLLFWRWLMHHWWMPKATQPSRGRGREWGLSIGQKPLPLPLAFMCQCPSTSSNSATCDALPWKTKWATLWALLLINTLRPFEAWALSNEVSRGEREKESGSHGGGESCSLRLTGCINI